MSDKTEKKTDAAEPEGPEQMALLPDKPLKLYDVMIELDKLPKTIHGPEPSAALVQSIKATGGVLERIIVVEAGDGKYKIEDGRRRVKAARLAEHDKIRATVLTKDQVRSGVLTIILNQQRDKNVVAEAEAIKSLLDAGASESDIWRETGMPIPAIRSRIKLVRNLDPELFKAFRAGKIKPSVAERASKLPKKAQARLVKTFEENKALTAAEVAEQRSVVINEGADKMPSSLWGGGKQAWRASAITQLGAILGGCEANLPRDQAGDVANDINAAIQIIQGVMAQEGKEKTA